MRRDIQLIIVLVKVIVVNSGGGGGGGARLYLKVVHDFQYQ